jgi:hypothetical protein
VAGDVDAHGETEHQRRDRELNELLQEIRVAQPGVQVLFGFLLVLPFQNRFTALPGQARPVLTVTLLAAALAGALLSAPTSVHRLNFRAHDKEWILQVSHRCIVAGTGVLASAMGGAVFVVVAALEGTGWATVAAFATALVLGWLWFVLPFLGPRRPDDHA